MGVTCAARIGGIKSASTNLAQLDREEKLQVSYAAESLQPDHLLVLEGKEAPLCWM